jgi:hypothetical protein
MTQQQLGPDTLLQAAAATGGASTSGSTGENQ